MADESISGNQESLHTICGCLPAVKGTPPHPNIAYSEQGQPVVAGGWPTGRPPCRAIGAAPPLNYYLRVMATLSLSLLLLLAAGARFADAQGQDYQQLTLESCRPALPMDEQCERIYNQTLPFRAEMDYPFNLTGGCSICRTRRTPT